MAHRTLPVAYPTFSCSAFPDGGHPAAISAYTNGAKGRGGSPVADEVAAAGPV